MPVAALKRLPTPPAPLTGKGLSSLLGELAAEKQVRAARLHLNEFLARDDEGYDRYAGIVNGVTGDIIDLLKGGHSIDVESIIDTLLTSEQRDQTHRRDIERQAKAAFADVSRRRPDAMPLMNEVLQAILARVDRLAELHRDARWRLMMARAEYQPSRGSGPIHGTPTDADEYLKSIS